MNEPNQVNPIELGTLIHEHRRLAGMSTTELAKRTGIDRSTIYRIEAGEFSEPSPQRLQRIASVLGTEIEDYFALAGYFTAHGMPSLAPYLRSKYDAAPNIAAEVEKYFRFLQEQEETKSETNKEHEGQY